MEQCLEKDVFKLLMLNVMNYCPKMIIQIGTMRHDMKIFKGLPPYQKKESIRMRAMIKRRIHSVRIDPNRKGIWFVINLVFKLNPNQINLIPVTAAQG